MAATKSDIFMVRAVYSTEISQLYRWLILRGFGMRSVACCALLRSGAFESVNMHIVITLSHFMQFWNNLQLHIQKGFKQLLVNSSRDTSAGIFFCGHCAVAQPWHHSPSSEFPHAPTHQSNGLFRNEINTLKANLSVWCSLSRLVTLSSLSSKAVCVKKEYLRGQARCGASVPHAVPLPLLLCPHLPVWSEEEKKQKVCEERSFSRRAQGASHSQLRGCRTSICLRWLRQRTVDELWLRSTKQAFVSKSERDRNHVSVTIWTFAFTHNPEIWPSFTAIYGYTQI